MTLTPEVIWRSIAHNVAAPLQEDARRILLIGVRRYGDLRAEEAAAQVSEAKVNEEAQRRNHELNMLMLERTKQLAEAQKRIAKLEKSVRAAREYQAKTKPLAELVEKVKSWPGTVAVAKLKEELARCPSPPELAT